MTYFAVIMIAASVLTQDQSPDLSAQQAELEFIQAAKHSDDLSISLVAAWQLLDFLPDRRSEISDQEIARFVGFVEGRLNVSAPKQWTEVLYVRKNRPWGLNQFGMQEDSVDDYKRLIVDYESLGYADDTRIRVGSHTVNTGEPFGLLKVQKVVIKGLSEECFAVALPARTHLRSYPIIFISKKGKVVWKSDIIANDVALNYGSPGWHLMEVAETNDHVIAFGIGSGYIYIEAFDKADGKRICRFISSLRIHNVEGKPTTKWGR